MAHLHTDMERFDIHVALELCKIVIESATIVAPAWAMKLFVTAVIPGFPVTLILEWALDQKLAFTFRTTTSTSPGQPIRTEIIPIQKTP